MASKIIVDQVQKSGGTAFTLPSADGAADTFMKTDGSGTLSFASAAAGFVEMRVFTAGTTWNRPTGVTKVVVEVAGAGGSGCKASSPQTRHGGGGGGYARKFIDVSSIATSTLTIGTGGAAVADGAGTGAGSAGGTSSWADGTNTITCTGGDGGSLTADQMSNGGTATGGDINIPGGRTAANWDYGFYGGSHPLGTAGQGNFSTVGVTKYYNAGGYGAGGGAGGDPSGSGAGAPGVIIVWEYK